MIYESVYWKKDLLKLSRKLTKRKRSGIWDEADHADFEKEIMIGFYIVRKLSEAQKLSNETISTKLQGFKIPSNGKKINHLSISQYPEYYDFENLTQAKLDIKLIWNNIIHSYVFSPFFSEEYNELLGIHFTSDSKRNICLFSLDIEVIIDFFKKVGRDYPMHISMTFNETTGDYKFHSSSSPILENDEN